MNSPYARSDRIRLLVVGVGSLVGRNILDSLEFPDFPRRHLVYVAGTNSVSDAPHNFRCDECHLVPPTASDEYSQAMRRVIRMVNPDLILSARDADTAALWKLFENDSTLPGKLPFGNLKTIRYALDKWQTQRFCRSHGLPYAESIVMGESVDLDQLRLFVERVGYPLVAKPVEGFASKGVFFVRSWDEVLHIRDKTNYLLQEYIGDAHGLGDYFRMLDGPKPLFTEAPGVSHHTCHIPIFPDGQLGEIFVLRNHHNFGAVTRLQRVHHPEVEAVARRFAEAFAAEGGRGPLSVQLREDRDGNPKAQEMNLRTTGSTYARLMMGQDEIGMMVRHWVGEPDFPVFTRELPAFDLTVVKSLTSDMVWGDAVAELAGPTQFWKAGGAFFNEPN